MVSGVALTMLPVELEDGTVIREESSDMVERISSGRLSA